ncbi:MAG: hypothetical protein Q8O87_03820 [bacterium]|nr:hypothetical protein [bacterium]
MTSRNAQPQDGGDPCIPIKGLEANPLAGYDQMIGYLKKKATDGDEFASASLRLAEECRALTQALDETTAS